MKAIIFDIDWVVIKSNFKKDEIIKNILQKYKLYDIPWVKDILSLWLNRKTLIEKVYSLVSFDKKAVLKNIDNEIMILENNPIGNDTVLDFIKKNYKRYIFCTNTAMPKDWLNRVIKALNIENMFYDLLASEDWNKVENVNSIINKYDLNLNDILFIDDNINHINKVMDTWVNTLHFTDYSIDIEKEIEKYTC